MASTSTPRKTRHSRHSSNRIPASETESDAAALAIAAAPPSRTNTELNLSVLRRYRPSIQSLLSIAANAVVYAFDSESNAWDKTGIEGTLFICTQDDKAKAPRDRARGAGISARYYNPRGGACIFILNRRGLDNLILDLVCVSHVEVTDGLVILRIEDEDGAAANRVLGLWIHNDKADTRDINSAMIRESWKAVRAAASAEAPGESSAEAPGESSAMPTTGKRISLSRLFGSQDRTSTDGCDVS